MRRVVLAAMSLLWLAGCSAVPRAFQPIDPIPPGEFSHRAFDEVLRNHVTSGVVNYPGVAADRRLTDYLAQVNRLDPNRLSTREARLAFWMNAYNAFAIKGIVDGYSPMTIWGQYRYFIARTYPVGGEFINLNDIEKKVLIPDFHEPRVHFAIVCASYSCPKLRSEAFDAAVLERQFDENARDFINDPKKNRFDRRTKVAHLSMIFKWFEEDFAAHSGSLLKYVRRYVAEPAVASELESYRIEYLDYDWSLNGIRYDRPS